ncbi:MAG: glyoxalase, partial [Jiangellaceae bacterium]
MLRHVAGAGVQLGAADHLYSEALYLSDPDGLGLEVYRDRRRAQWRLRPDGQIHAVTEPLDAEGLAAAGQGLDRVTWSFP